MRKLRSPLSRRVPRFRLQTLLVLVTAFCVVLGLITRDWRPAHRRKQAVAEVLCRGGRVRLADPPEATGVISGWLHLVLGEEYFAEVRSVTWSPGSEEDLDLLRAFPGLTGLRLVGPAVTDAALRRLTGLAQLEGLTLVGGVISEHGLESLTELPNLHALQLANCSLSDDRSERGLKVLAELPNLRYLELADCSLSDDRLKALYGAPSLVDLRLREANVTESAILAIRAANPALAVSFGSSRSKEDPEDYRHGHVRSAKAAGICRSCTLRLPDNGSWTRTAQPPEQSNGSSRVPLSDHR